MADVVGTGGDEAEVAGRLRGVLEEAEAVGGAIVDGRAQLPGAQAQAQDLLQSQLATRNPRVS